MNLVFFGPPGSGKGTQGALLSERRGLLRISTGDILRDAARAGTALGLAAKRYMDAGELVPDDVILGLVREAIEDAGGTAGFIMDGFPRTIPQAEGVDQMLAELKKPIDSVVLLDVDDETLVQRLSGRRSCPNCGQVYNVYSDPPEQDETCDRCGARLVQRADDHRDTVVRRLDVYRKQTAPVLAYYEKHGVPVHKIDGDQGIERVQQEILKAIER